MNSRICVLIPAYNASKTIMDVVTGALKHVPVVMVADDGSDDNTAACAKEAGAEVIKIEKNSGKGYALKTLFLRAIDEGFDAVITMDADGQHDPDDIPSFLTAHREYTEDIIVGSRMKQREKIPRARFNSMKVARFYISFAANQFIKDTQCGYRLYPVVLLKTIVLTTGGYTTETEILMKAGDSGCTVRFVDVRTIYNESGSHFKPVRDLSGITAYVIFYLTMKWTIEGFSSNRPFTYKQNGLYDLIGNHKNLCVTFQAITVLAALPFSVFCLFQYKVLSYFIPENFASVRKTGCSFYDIVLATVMLPCLLIIGLTEKILHMANINKRLVDRCVERFYPDLW